MLKFRIPAEENYKTEIRPVALKSLNQVLNYFDLNQNHLIFFNGEMEVSSMIGTVFTDKKGVDQKTDVGYDNKIFIELEYDYSGYGDELDSGKSSPTTPRFWYDDITGSSIRPIYNGRKMSVTVNKFFRDRAEAQAYHARIRSVMLSPRLNTLFSTNVHYPINTTVLECYKTIYDRLVKAGIVLEDTDNNFITWFKSKSVVPCDIIVNQSYNNPTFVFLKSIEENGILFDTPQIAKVNKGNFIGTFEVSFTYSYYWALHTEYELEYPIQVYQQLTPTKYIPEIFEENTRDHAFMRFYESKVAMFVSDYLMDGVSRKHVIPKEDNWRAPTVDWLSNQLQILVNLEYVEEQVILNIKEIHGFNWNETFLNYILKYRDKVTIRHKSPFNFKLYSNEMQVLETELILKDNGDLVLLRNPKISNIYRLVFSLDYALRRYDDEAVNDIITDPDYGKWIIDVLFPNFPIWPTFPEGGLPDWEDVHNNVNVGDGDENIFVPNWMLGSVIIAHNEDSFKDYKKYEEQLMEKRGYRGTEYNRE